MSRASVIVALWLLLTGNVGDAVLAPPDAMGGVPGRSPVALLVFYAAITALTVVALWAEFAGGARETADGSTCQRSAPE